MASKNNSKDLGEKLKELAKLQLDRANLKPAEKPETIADLVAEGNKLLKTPKTPNKTATPPPPINPYLQARTIVLNRLPRWKQSEIARMEESKDMDNYHYNDFIREVAEEGDKLSP